ncbi:M23 family metallopeptidase [Aquimarina sp. RZ0]|uniref:M23 family metallopeptidase n=1 Tax=Aquimarina sp. RZ0 TaxID=2607730 RepID=UPI0011F3C988|nr:M23 family metallopeptidase [Aquimarina sp. RZ0]KAA1242360.1 M23 family metallopeptidase [Aquimarina sp. RZ0]
MKHDNDPQVMSVEAYIAEREKEAEEKGERKPRIRPNVNYTSFVLNEVEDVNLEYTGKNEVLKIKLSDSKGTEIKYGKEIHNNQEYTYEVIKLDEKDKDAVEKDLKKIKWCFWLPEFRGFDNKQAKHILSTSNKPEHKVDFLSGDDATKILAIKSKAILYAKKEIVEKDGKKVAILKVKFSKWLDGHKIKVEAYLSGKKGKGDTVATRVLAASPEILEAYWLNAAGRKITNTGYKQDVYLYLKTLGLKGKTIETQVFDKDIHPNPVPQIGTDDAVEWKNNKINIEGREVIKQFKVGDKSRYKKAQQDEATEDNPFIGLYDFKNKKTYNLELYIHIANSEALKIKGVKPKYGHLNLIPEEKIINAFFAKTEIEEVQADAPEIKDKKTKKTKLPPKAKVPYYEKLNEGAIGQKIQLVAECANLEGKKVLFKIYEKEPLLVEKGKELPVLKNDVEELEIEATVKDGYAVAEVKLRQKSDEDFKKWLEDILKIDGKPDDRKRSHFWIRIETDNVEIPIKKEFLKRNAFEVISTNWHEPVDDPQIALWNSEGTEKPQSNTFGMGRGRLHTGLDIFAMEGSTVYACLDGTVYEKKWHGGYGWTITIKINNTQELANRRQEYTHAYTTDKDSGSNFTEDKDPVFLFYAHLQDIFIKKGQKVKAGMKIGLTGISGVTKGTHDPHLHFNIFSTIYAIGKESYKKAYLADPALYVDWKTETELTEDDKKTQKDRMKQGKLINKKPKLSNTN